MRQPPLEQISGKFLLLSMIPLSPFIPPHTERYETLPCVLHTCDLFLDRKVLYFVLYFCKSAFQCCPQVGSALACLCSHHLHAPPDRLLPFGLVWILQEALPQSSYFCPHLAHSCGFRTNLLRYCTAFLPSLAALLMVWMLPCSSCGLLYSGRNIVAISSSLSHFRAHYNSNDRFPCPSEEHA